jgi:hypothetical protein
MIIICAVSYFSKIFSIGKDIAAFLLIKADLLETVAYMEDAHATCARPIITFLKEIFWGGEVMNQAATLDTYLHAATRDS